MSNTESLLPSVVKELTNDELLKGIDPNDQYQRGWYQGGFYAKKRSDEYWKQEVAKKDQEIEQLKESQVEFGEWMIISGYAKLHFNEDSLSVSDIHTTYLDELNNKSHL